MEFLDTRLIEPEEEEFENVSEKILKLQDKLAEEIVFSNIQEDLENCSDLSSPRVNYVQFFKDRYDEINSADGYYDEDYMYDVVNDLANIILPLMEKHYKVTLAESYEQSSPNEYLQMLSVMYEFFFVRQYQNIVDYFYYTLKREYEKFVYKYHPFFNKEPYDKDLFIGTQKKKFKNINDVIIIHFMNEIVNDIADSLDSMFVFADQVTTLDLFEEVNHQIHDYLMTYGNSIVFHEDADAIEAYVSPLENPDNRILIRNELLLKLLPELELIEEEVDVADDDFESEEETTPVLVKESTEEKTDKMEIEYVPVKNITLFKKHAEDLLGGYGDMSDSKIKKTTKEIHINGELKGYVGFSTYDQDDGAKALGLGNLMILERNKGYGSAVIDDIVAKHKKEYNLIYAYVNAENTKAIRLYKRLGRVYDRQKPNENNEFYVTFYDDGKFLT